MSLRLPRYVIAKSLANGSIGFYFNIPTRYRKEGCTIPNEPLGNDYSMACGADGNGGRAAALNGRLDVASQSKALPGSALSIGYFENTRRANDTQSVYLNARDRTRAPDAVGHQSPIVRTPNAGLP